MPRLNYTGRKKIFRQDALITVQDINGILSFKADLNLKSYNLSDDAMVFIEAYCSNVWQRFSYGTVNQIDGTKNFLLTDFDSLDGILFRVKVTQRDGIHGKLVAAAKQIRPRKPEEGDANRIALLPVKSQEMDCIWKVDFTDSPVLLISKQVGNKDIIALSSEFLSLVYPAVFREILYKVIYDRPDDPEDMEDWKAYWLKFAEMLPGTGEIPAESDEHLYDEWIDDAISAFARSQNVLDKFTSYWQGRDD